VTVKHPLVVLGERETIDSKFFSLDLGVTTVTSKLLHVPNKCSWNSEEILTMQEISVSVKDYGFSYTQNESNEKVIDATKIDVVMKMPTPSPYF